MPRRAASQATIEHEHSREAIRLRLATRPPWSYLRDWIYGGIDGVLRKGVRLDVLPHLKHCGALVQFGGPSCSPVLVLPCRHSKRITFGL